MMLVHEPNTACIKSSCVLMCNLGAVVDMYGVLLVMFASLGHVIVGLGPVFLRTYQ